MKVQKTRTGERNEGTSVCIYGDSGVGKTSLLDAFPEGKLLILSFDKGLAVLRRSHDYLEFTRTAESLKAMAETLNELMGATKRDYAVVAIDDISELEICFRFSFMDLRGKKFLELREYGNATQKMQEYILRFRDLTEKGYDVVFLAKEQLLEVQKTGDETESKFYPLVSKSLAPHIAGKVDIVGRLFLSSDGTRMFQLDGSKSVNAKCRLPIARRFEKPDLIGLLKRARAHRTGGEVKLPADPFAEKKGAKK